MLIQLPNDELTRDEALAVEWNTTTRTLRLYDHLGLPFWIVAGRKYRGKRSSAEWLAKRVGRPTQEPQISSPWGTRRHANRPATVRPAHLPAS